jgi:two-component system, NtrC family, response regulator AtoC
MAKVPDPERVLGWTGETETEAAPVTAPPEMARTMLVCRFGKHTSVVELQAGEELLIGRQSGRSPKTLVVDETRVSRRHARVVQREGQLVVIDLKSRNGTLVGKDLVRGAERPLFGGDIVRVGSAELIVATATRAPRSSVALASDNVVADPEMDRAYALGRKVARSPTNVLLLGETGVGKEVLAQRIHAWSSRAAAPFVRVNCAAVPEALLESELFGHEKGAFTGADRRKIGYCESAHGGTLFIDEIGELSLHAQVKLLNVLESRTITRVGDTAPIAVDVRVICATHRDLQDAIAKGTFRADLFYRIGSFVIRIPPLRARSTEVDAFAHMFARAFAAAAGERPPSISMDALAILRGYSWPGNVRELRNVIEHAMVMAEGEPELLRSHLPEQVAAPAPSVKSRVGGDSVKDKMSDFERRTVEEALAAEGGNQTRAAKRLGISRRALVYKLTRYRQS